VTDRSESPDPSWPALFERESEVIDGKGGPGGGLGQADADWRRDPPETERVGLALSGGGIRSATFNLGVLQKLHELRVLDRFDYLSTVSGGGYVGAFWSAWKSRPSAQTESFPAATDHGAEPPAIHHLREFSNFLRPRPKLLSSETGNIAAGVVGAVFPSLTISLALLTLVLSLWALLARAVLGEPSSASVPWVPPALAVVAVTAVTQAWFELYWRWHNPVPSPSQRGTEGAPRDGRAPWAVLWSALLACCVAGGLWALLWHLVPLPFEELLAPAGAEDGKLAAITALLPAIAWVGATVVLVTVRVALSRWVKTWRPRCWKGALDRVLSRVILCAATWAALALVWVVGRHVAAEGIGWITTLATGGAAGGLFAWVRRFLGRQPNKPAGGKLRLLAAPWLLTALSYVVVVAFSVLAATLLISLDPYSVDKIEGAAKLSSLTLAAAAFLFDPQQNGFHAFYRQRLVRAFLGASNRGARDGATVEDEKDDLVLPALPTRPFHLICCAANDLAADPLTTLRRGADSAVLSRVGLQIGGSWRPWPLKARATPTLGSAITASAAAFNSLMGSKSVRLGVAGTFLLGAVGARLGLWIEGARRPHGPFARAAAWLPRLFPGLLYLRELFGGSRAHSTWIHLSDGGHFENLALYELIRRHCRCILLCDCGADPDVAFDDFGNAVRRIREDFGVEIEIDLRPVRPGPDGVAAQPMVAGDIRYPTGDLGILLYLKPTLVGDEPADIAQYARRNDAFPHETTLDQFYDEAQWEAYRKLGEHIAERALGAIVRRLLAETRTGGASAPLEAGQVVRLFLHARYAWPPDGADDPALTASVEQSWNRLEDRLEQPEAAALRRQLLPSASGQDGKPSEEALAHALPLVREALRLMETTILDTGMAATPEAPSHPRYMGWLNRFGRWTAAPLFRAWWPWLAPVHTQATREFLESKFGLPRVARLDGELRLLRKKDRQGPSWTEWAISGKPRPQRGMKHFGLLLDMPGLPNGRFLSAIVAVELNHSPNPTEVSWDRESFFVPSGLWGVGIGERVLGELIRTLRTEKPWRSVRRVTVRSEHKSIEWEALYMGAGFQRDGETLERDLHRKAPPESAASPDS